MSYFVSVSYFIGDGWNLSGWGHWACYRIEKGRTIVKFPSCQKSSEIPNKKKNAKNVADDKFFFTPHSKIFINESLIKESFITEVHGVNVKTDEKTEKFFYIYIQFRVALNRAKKRIWLTNDNHSWWSHLAHFSQVYNEASDE